MEPELALTSTVNFHFCLRKVILKGGLVERSNHCYSFQANQASFVYYP